MTKHHKGSMPHKSSHHRPNHGNKPKAADGKLKGNDEKPQTYNDKRGSSQPSRSRLQPSQAPPPPPPRPNPNYFGPALAVETEPEPDYQTQWQSQQLEPSAPSRRHHFSLWRVHFRQWDHIWGQGRCRCVKYTKPDLSNGKGKGRERETHCAGNHVGFLLCEVDGPNDINWEDKIRGEPILFVGYRLGQHPNHHKGGNYAPGTSTSNASSSSGGNSNPQVREIGQCVEFWSTRIGVGRKYKEEAAWRHEIAYRKKSALVSKLVGAFGDREHWPELLGTVDKLKIAEYLDVMRELIPLGKRNGQWTDVAYEQLMAQGLVNPVRED